MYQIGEVIVYGDCGVCRVVGYTGPDTLGVAGAQLYYTLKPMFQDYFIYAPVNTKVFMRPAISAEEAERLIAAIPDVEAEVYHSQRIQQLAEHYRSQLACHDCGVLLHMTMSIYKKKQYLEQHKLKFGQIDARFMKQGEDLLFGELAVALNIPREQVPVYIESRVREQGEVLTT